ncbi:MAG TPA: hypothetical protein ENI76_05130 [Ignavibacteria bacterium]|nr:hypothetical protein [Ignavibacteria bacterium]
MVGRLYRYIIKNILDRLFYIDWDMLEKVGAKDELVQHYLGKNKLLKEIANSGDVPEFYYKRLSSSKASS